MTGSERFGANLKEWRLRRDLTQEQLGEKVGADGPRIGRLEKGSENPTLETIDKLGDALDVDVSVLHAPRSEESGRAATGENHPILERLIAQIDTEYEGEDSWRGDVLKAVAALNRALRRQDPGATAGPIAKSGR